MIKRWPYRPLRAQPTRIEIEKSMLASPPADVRELFDAISAQPPATSVECFVERFDWSKTLVSDIYYAILNRIPESAKVVEKSAKTDRAQLARAALRSPEFQERMLNYCSRLFRRSGASFIFMSRKRPARTYATSSSVNILISMTFIGCPVRPRPTSYSRIWRRQCRRLQNSDQIVATGHFPLAWYVNRALLRPRNDFCYIREPRRKSLIPPELLYPTVPGGPRRPCSRHTNLEAISNLRTRQAKMQV